MRSLKILANFIGAGIALAAMSAIAEASDLDLCREGGRRPETQMAACNRLIQAGSLDDETLREVLVARASAYSDAGNRAGALADLDRQAAPAEGSGRRIW